MSNVSGSSSVSKPRVSFATRVIACVMVVVMVAGVVALRDAYVVGAAVLVLIAIVALGRWLRAGPVEAADMGRLIALCYGDREMAERLVAGEGRRAPSISRRELVRRASERLREDRRR